MPGKRKLSLYEASYIPLSFIISNEIALLMLVEPSSIQFESDKSSENQARKQNLAQTPQSRGKNLPSARSSGVLE
jgi:hypothetical protein